jgi:hypothetical protein
MNSSITVKYADGMTLVFQLSVVFADVVLPSRLCGNSCCCKVRHKPSSPSNGTLYGRSIRRSWTLSLLVIGLLLKIKGTVPFIYKKLIQVLTRCRVPVTINGGPSGVEVKTLPKHKKNPDVGDKKTVYSSTILIDQEDAQSFEDQEEVRLPFHLVP